MQLLCYNGYMNSKDNALKRILTLRLKLDGQPKRGPQYRTGQRDHYLGTVVGGRQVMLHVPNKRPWLGYCELCGVAGVKLDYHHWDDDNPSKGLWLCTRHHRFAEVVDKSAQVLVDEYIRLREGVEEEFRQKGLEPVSPSLLDEVMGWSLVKEV